jgi:hypothetical protein
MQDTGCKSRVRVFRNMNGNPAGIPALPSGIGIRYGCQVSGAGYLVPGTRYRISANVPNRAVRQYGSSAIGQYDNNLLLVIC